ncbi:MAG: 2-phosphosulfolactate phosphatase [Planctomycetaceae bacterium]|jgi:2-phosphosulfolactate phosphatase
MTTEIQVHLLPDHIPSERLRGGIAVIVDVLRASTTIVSALHHGAAAVIPCSSVDEARTHAAADATLLLGGERCGVTIDGFDLSNSPADYAGATIKDRTIAFTTTNGTRALLRSVRASKVLIGAFVNVECLASYLNACSQPIHVVCAGTDGEITGEDALFAGCLIDRVLNTSAEQARYNLTDTAAMTLGWWRFESIQRPLYETLMTTQGGRNLLALSFETDIELAADADRCPVLPHFDVGSGLITL